MFLIGVENPPGWEHSNWLSPSLQIQPRADFGITSKEYVVVYPLSCTGRPHRQASKASLLQ